MRLRYQRVHAGAVLGLMVTSIVACGSARAEAQDTLRKGVQPRVVTLNNGLKLILVERHEQPTVAAGLFFSVGSCNDPAGQSGIAHLFEHMLFKGTRTIGTTDYAAEKMLIDDGDKIWAKLNAEMVKMREQKKRGLIDDVLNAANWTPEYKALKAEYGKLIEKQREYIKDNELANIYTANGGSGLNAGTAQDITLYYVQLPANKLELFFWLESDRMQNGIMREFYIERDNVREERRLRTDSTPTGKYDEAFDAMFWQVHPYGVPIIGWASEVESITRDDVRAFYKIFYAPNNCRLAIAGDFDTDEVIEMANRYFGRIPRGAEDPPALVTEEPKPIALRRFYAEAETNPIVRLRYHTVAIGHRDEAALDVLGGLLSGKTGRLYKRLVAQDDSAIGVPGASNLSRKYAGYFESTITVKEGKALEDVEQAVLEEIEKLRTGEITDHELQKVKNQVLAGSIRSLKSNLGLMFQLGWYDTWYDWSYINESPARMLEVTVDDIRRVVDTYLDPDIRTVAFYRTKGGDAAPADDPELAALLAQLPAEVHTQVRGMVADVRNSTDMNRLEQMANMADMALSGGSVPPEQVPVFEFLAKASRARAAELMAEGKEAVQDESK